MDLPKLLHRQPFRYNPNQSHETEYAPAIGRLSVGRNRTARPNSTKPSLAFALTYAAPLHLSWKPLEACRHTILLQLALCIDAVMAHNVYAGWIMLAT